MPERCAKAVSARISSPPERDPAAGASLRDRHGDIELLSSHFLARYSARFNKPVPSLGPTCSRPSPPHPWPGNVREFENVMEFMVNMAPSGGVLHPDMLPASVRGALPSSAPSSAPSRPAGSSARDLERNAILDAVRRGDDTPGKKAAAAASASASPRSTGS
ncbi:MAG: hypothetical protein ACLRWP_08165 [Bilophila wadsworthia]